MALRLAEIPPSRSQDLSGVAGTWEGSRQHMDRSFDLPATAADTRHSFDSSGPLLDVDQTPHEGINLIYSAPDHPCFAAGDRDREYFTMIANEVRKSVLVSSLHATEL